jgi:predicted nucleic acid-binding Zn ribbon protein
MPTYDYECLNRHKTTVTCSMDLYRREVTCPKCKGVAYRTLSPVPTTFRHADSKANKGNRK